MENELLLLTPEEEKLLALVRGLGYGELSVTVENGAPVTVTELRQSVLLES